MTNLIRSQEMRETISKADWKQRFEDELVGFLTEWDVTIDEAKELVARSVDRFEGILQNRAEAAYERQQERLMESGGPDDSAYRRAMKEAGRGHLLR